MRFFHQKSPKMANFDQKRLFLPKKVPLPLVAGLLAMPLFLTYPQEGNEKEKLVFWSFLFVCLYVHTHLNILLSAPRSWKKLKFFFFLRVPLYVFFDFEKMTIFSNFFTKK
jgi:hypothetical protein